MKMRFQFGAVFIAWLAAGLLCGPAYSQTPLQQRRAARQERRQQILPPNGPNGLRPGPNADNLPPKAIEHLQDLPPNRQEQFLRNNQRFQNLPPEQQAQIRDRLQAWNRLTPEQQQNLRERQHVWEQLTPVQRQYVRQTLLPHWQQLPPVRRQAIMQRLHSLRDMSESDRQAKLNDPAFLEGLNTEDRETLTQLAHLHVGMAPDTPGI
jgi:hypothetical protein